jgi:hypothetical protein
MCPSVLCWRLFNQTRARAGDGRPTRHDHLFSVRTSWDYLGAINRNYFVGRRSAARTCWIPGCTRLVAAGSLRCCRFVRWRAVSAVINLQNSMANASTWNSSFARPRHSKFQSSRMATVSESAFTRIIGKAVTLLSIGLQSQEIPSTLSFPVKSLSSRTARVGRCSPRSVTSRSRRNLLS